jgi:hypothetical protein
MAMPETTPQPRGAARTLSVIAGAIAGFLAVGLLIAGGVALWANAKKDDAGYISTKTEHFSTRSYAIATDNLEANLDAPHWIISQDHYGKVRLKVTPNSDKPLFVGIAPTRDVQAYLRSTAHETLTDVSYPSFHATYAFNGGRRPPAAPTAQRFPWPGPPDADVDRPPRLVVDRRHERRRLGRRGHQGQRRRAAAVPRPAGLERRRRRPVPARRRRRPDVRRAAHAAPRRGRPRHARGAAGRGLTALQ